MKKFEDLTSKELWQLRQQVVINSLFIADYENSFGYDARDLSYFFDGYVETLFDLESERGGLWTDYDTEENLYAWFSCYDDLSWIKSSVPEEIFS